MTSFTQKVFAVVKQIPPGKTLSYKEVATQAGSPRAFRAVGNILNKNYDRLIPCHRVIHSNGSPGGYNRGATKKIQILTTEKAIYISRTQKLAFEIGQVPQGMKN